MPRRKRRTKKQPETAPESIAETIKKRRRRRKPVAEPVPIVAEPKTLMQRIFESQRAELDRLNEALRTKIFEE